jgi:hypothetical protein
MHWTRSAPAAGIAALLITLLLSPAPSAAQSESGQRAPRIRVYSQSGAIASRYVTPAIQVSEDAYVFVVSFDVDGQIQILHPEFPGIAVRMLKNRELRLRNFFAGFARSDYAGAGRYISSSEYAGSDNDSRGSVIALASRAPFNLGRLETGGDWNISAIRHVIEYRSPLAAAQALARYLGAGSEPIGMDYLRFAPARYNDYYASGPAYSCDLYYGGDGRGVAVRRLAVLQRVTQMQEGGRSVRVIGYDSCGMPVVAYGSSQPNDRYRPRTGGGDSLDTLVSKGHVRPRRSAQSAEGVPAAAFGDLPLTRQAEIPGGGDVLIAPLPRQRRRDPREIFADPPNEGRVGRSAELSRTPVERGERQRGETTVIGTLPAREFSRPIERPTPMMQAPRPVRDPAPSEPPRKH